MDYVRMKDRRTSIRFPISLSVQCFDRQSRNEILSQTYDISTQGIGLLINEKVSLGAPVTVTITMPDT
ncbi:MAG: PilZ domain-containing protein, partial [Candidatus Omnitrophica bacterium]|nr:PilZ domain-containing protein [Candidatus Omnitrophota bacterium]